MAFHRRFRKLELTLTPMHHKKAAIPGYTFQHDDARPAFDVMKCLAACPALPRLVKSPADSPIEHIWATYGNSIRIFNVGLQLSSRPEEYQHLIKLCDAQDTPLNSH
ncbi:hypothetical protein TNCV_4934161 [Trichonephila clavipes]|nr:hypothetical protein TNCV_4934161 [Trichonephila clavipes]